mmetsp:Transcript_35285/g.109927  ORF Transcript_35285/g.109927 Transcript_35285/m.109927 type:complete len:281 (+) Transcript_35285:503-1345(+)
MRVVSLPVDCTHHKLQEVRKIGELAIATVFESLHVPLWCDRYPAFVVSRVRYAGNKMIRLPHQSGLTRSIHCCHIRDEQAFHCAAAMLLVEIQVLPQLAQQPPGDDGQGVDLHVWMDQAATSRGSVLLEVCQLLALGMRAQAATSCSQDAQRMECVLPRRYSQLIVVLGRFDDHLACAESIVLHVDWMIEPRASPRVVQLALHERSAFTWERGRIQIGRRCEIRKSVSNRSSQPLLGIGIWETLLLDKLTRSAHSANLCRSCSCFIARTEWATRVALRLF